MITIAAILYTLAFLLIGMAVGYKLGYVDREVYEEHIRQMREEEHERNIRECNC